MRTVRERVVDRLQQLDAESAYSKPGSRHRYRAYLPYDGKTRPVMTLTQFNALVEPDDNWVVLARFSC
jgi:hypothetical protein